MEMLKDQPDAVIQDALVRAPETMAALMRKFIDKKDVDTRVQVKMQMKALLDFASVDTTFPENPLPDSKIKPARDIVGGGPVIAPIMNGGVYGGNGVPVHGMNEQAAGPAAPRINNGDIVQ